MPLIRSNVDNENLEIFDTATTRRKVDWIRPAESVLNNRTNYCYKSVAAVVGEIREKINIFQKKKKKSASIDVSFVRRSTWKSAKRKKNGNHLECFLYSNVLLIIPLSRKENFGK